MPDLIETRPFTVHPELYAWPSFRIFSERVLWAYILFAGAVTLLVKLGMQLSLGLAILTGIAIVGIALGFTFIRYKAFLQKPENRQIYRNCVVSLTQEEVRQDFTDSSYMEIKLFAVKTFRDIGDFYFIFATPKHGIVVPKTAFESPEESREFADRVRAAQKRKPA
ncbi:MAG TPA: hypothetical protein VHE55_18835 [Fimbriimonadaceae bacterium]|nr:hypothetical protein [Fimbriimonadaceae bacterium]